MTGTGAACRRLQRRPLQHLQPHPPRRPRGAGPRARSAGGLALAHAGRGFVTARRGGAAVQELHARAPGHQRRRAGALAPAVDGGQRLGQGH
eukprot:scaffold9405_cov84-Isochrysis_galbana.AAC.1